MGCENFLMSEKELLREYKNSITLLTQEKNDVVKLASEKDARIKQLLIQVENCNGDTQIMGKKIAELESKLKKKQKIKRVIDEKITEILENSSKSEEKKDDESVDKGGADMLKDVYEK